MTGNNTSPGEKLRAVFLASLMVLSVFAAGMAFTGTAAAAGNASFSASDTTAGATPATLTGGTNVALSTPEVLSRQSDLTLRPRATSTAASLTSATQMSTSK
ncbi:hypothetical protein GJ629_07545 [Halapricum sp. CBA1109]|uniref:surface glycoprotein n=1 Tax=Halapricum sp. CBA1109 TaxID=2668068 RepID=UPI0012FADF4A|nr:surface glycoprotein [Halapricum sp. CBA1109]MUV89766.1 hypothetical protein [Halapricum sp. CBA1109]